MSTVNSFCLLHLALFCALRQLAPLGASSWRDRCFVLVAARGAVQQRKAASASPNSSSPTQSPASYVVRRSQRPNFIAGLFCAACVDRHICRRSAFHRFQTGNVTVMAFFCIAFGLSLVSSLNKCCGVRCRVLFLLFLCRPDPPPTSSSK